MLESQKLELRASEIRQKLNDLSSLDSLTDEQSAEIDTLTAEYKSVETRRRAAIVAEDVTETPKEGEDAETRERRELRGKARVGDYLAAALTGRGVTGASGEYADAVGTPGLMPLELLEDREREDRAVTPGPSSETVTTTRPTVPFAFARTDAAALGIAMPMVASGESHHPALTTAPPAGPKAKDAAADSTAAAFTLSKRTPGRITGQFVVRVEDLALFPAMENDLRRAIGSAMADNLDEQVIEGDGTGANLDGLFKIATDVAAAAAKETYPSAVARWAALVDGIHAHSMGDVRALIGTATFAAYAALFRNGSNGNVFDYLAMKMAGLRVSTRVPAVANQAQKAIAVLGAQGQPVVVPIWRGVEMVVDPYTAAAKGQRVVTAVSLVGSPFAPYGASQVIEVHPKLS